MFSLSRKFLIVALLFSVSSFGQGNINVNGGTPIQSYIQYGTSLKGNGIVSDADLSLYSTTFGTDQTAAIQTILNTASATNPLTIIWDVKVSCTGLRIKSYTTINALPGCGAILRDGANNWLLSNYNWTANSNSFVDSNIVINGGIWNGNGFRSGTSYQANNTTAKGQITVVNFFGTKNVRLQNAQFLNSSSWCVTFITSQNILIDNCIINDGVGQKYQDGIDFLGFANHMRVNNCYITCGDDRLVLCPNSTGGVNGIIDHTVYTNVDGDQTDIVYSNISFVGDGKGIAGYFCGGNIAKDITFENISGVSQTCWVGIWNQDILSGYTLTTGSKVPTNIVFNNIDIDVPTYAPYGLTTYPLALISCSAQDLVFKNIKRTDYTLPNETFGVYNAAGGGTSITVQNLIIDGYRSYNTSPAQSVDQIYVAGATVKNLLVNNCSVDMGSTTIQKAFINIRSGATVTNPSINNNNINGMKYVFQDGGTVTNGRVLGLTHTGQGGSDPSVYVTGTMTTLWMSNYIGVLSTSGTITTKKGDAFL